NLEDKIVVPVPNSSPCCARCGTPVDGPSCRGCAFLRKKFDEDLLAYYVENGIFKDFQDTSESSDDNTNVVNALREPCVVNQDPGEKSSQGPPQIDQNCCYECGDSLEGIFCRQCICKSYGKESFSTISLLCKLRSFDHPQPSQDSVDPQGILQVLNKMEEKLEEIIRDRRKKIEDMSIEEMMHEQQLVNREIKEIINDLDFNIWGSEVRKKEQAYEEEKYFAACRYMLSVTCNDEDDYIPLGDIIARNSTSKSITPDLSIGEPDNSLNMGDEHLDTILETELDEVIKSSVENLVPIPREFEGICNDTCDVLTCDNDRIDVESELVESLINRDTSIVYSSKIDPIFEEFAGELAHIAPIPPRIVEDDFDSNDDTSSDDDFFENIEYVDASLSYIEYDSFKEENEEQEEKEFDLEDIFQIQDVILRKKLLNVHRLISKIESLKDNPTPDRVFESPSPFPIPVADSDSFLEESNTSFSHLDNSLPEFETFSDHTEETRSGSTTTHDNYSLPKYESFHFDNPSFPRPPPEPSDVCLDMLYNDESFEPGEGENIVVSNVEEDDSFTFTICTFLPFLTYPEVSPLSCSTGSEDLIFDLGIIRFHFLKPLTFLWKFFSSIFSLPKDE
ncbi:hypothetical protein Tco_0634083, partial [Tanacetum coccineum]